MEISLIGINHKRADIRQREIVAKTITAVYEEIRQSVPAVLLSTCNRTELYMSGPQTIEVHEKILHTLHNEYEMIQQKIYSLFGQDCFMHLVKVTAGLDSAIIGETEIQCQVKRAYIDASRNQKLSKELHVLFQKSLQMSKDIRRQNPISPQKPLSELVLSTIQTKSSTTKPRILFFGASSVNIALIEDFIKHNYTDLQLTSRSLDYAKKVLSPYTIEYIEWDSAIKKWDRFDVVITATTHSEYIIQHKIIENRVLLIDLAVPRNIDPKLTIEDKCMLLNIDELTNTSYTTQVHAKRPFIEKQLQDKITYLRSKFSLSKVEALAPISNCV